MKRQRLLVIPITACHLAWIALVVGLIFLPTTGRAGTLASFSDAAGQHVFYTGSTDFHIHQLYWSHNGGWVNQDLTLDSKADRGAVSGATLAAFSDGAGEHVFYLCPSGGFYDVCQLFFNGSWINQDVTFMAGGVQTAWPTLTAFSDSYGEHVFYIGLSDAHLYQLYIAPGGLWVNQDLTGMTGANNVAQGPLASFTDFFGEHAVYSRTGATYQFLFNGQDWANQNLTASAKTSMLDTGSALSAVSDDYGEHIFYVGGPKRHMNQLVFHDYPTGYRWVNQDLTLASGASIIPELLTALSSYSDSAGTYTYYIGTDANVYELYSEGIIQPRWVNLGLTYNAPAVVDCSAITSFNNAYGQHVYYTAYDGFVHQLYKASGSSIWSDAPLPDGNVGGPSGCPIT